MFSETYPHEHISLAGHVGAKGVIDPMPRFVAAGSAPSATTTSLPSKQPTARSSPQTPNKRVAFLINTIAKIDQLLLIWLSRPETQNLLRELISDLKARIPEVIRNQLPFNHKPLLTPTNPSKAKGTEPLPKPSSSEIPRFFFPSAEDHRNAGEQPSEETQREYEVLRTALEICKKHNANTQATGTQQTLYDVWVAGHPHVTIEQFVEMMKTLCGLPTFLSTMLYAHLSKQQVQGQQGPPKEERCPFARFWKKSMANVKDFDARCFQVIKETSEDDSSPNFLTYGDLERLTKEVIRVHPGLEFLQETPEFQQRYLETVITRVLYGVSGSLCEGKHRRRLSKEQFVTCKLGTTLAKLEQEDISQNTTYFSYEHFYVIYCKFWELDGNHDLLLDKHDLCEYSNRTLSRRIVDRIFELPRHNRQIPKDKMTYEDFVWFILSEEDKNTDMSAEYWFKCVDTDEDGYLSAYEMQYIYQEQEQRMIQSKVEPIHFHDLMCQFVDMVKPKDMTRISLKDIKRSGLAAHFFNMLFNFDKLLFCEQEPQPMSITSANPSNSTSATIRHGDNPNSEWNKFAAAEYQNLTNDGGELNQSTTSDQEDEF